MKKYAKYLIKEMGINWYIAVKAMYLNNSEGYFSIYQKFKMCIHYKKDKDYVLNDIRWQLSMRKDFAQYQ